MYGRLIVLKKSGAEGGTCNMTNETLYIGRDPEKCDIQIRLPEVSKMQARLETDDMGQIWFENLSQTNPGGTQLNGEVLMQKRMLSEKDVIIICGRRFRFEYGAQCGPVASGSCPSPLPSPLSHLECVRAPRVIAATASPPLSPSAKPAAPPCPHTSACARSRP